MITNIQKFGRLYHPEEPAYYGEAEHGKEEQDLHKIPGVPGHDYPIYHEVPETSFDCGQVPAVPGMYANVETGCQAYHGILAYLLLLNINDHNFNII